MSNNSHTKDDLINFKPEHDFFIGIDSDGCVFDTMEIKQKQCFHSIIISHWHLEPIEKYLRETAEFVNLYSKWRGQNRFLTLIMTFDLLRERPEVKESGIALPVFTSLKKLIDSGIPLGNPAIEKVIHDTGDKELISLLKWSKDINKKIEATVKNLPPFKWARKSLKKISENVDAICVSQTPCEALIREWHENDILQYVSIIAGQELGTKTEHISFATKDKYNSSNNILMIGDAPGDKKAAKANNALFYPVNPGQEETSWERFYKEAFDKFISGEFNGDYEEKIITEFEALLPDTPPWKTS